MKVGIITCHDVYNFGSSLQAYALSKMLSDICKVEIIDYKPDYLYRLLNFLEVDAAKWQQNVIRRWIYRIYVAPKRLQNLKRYLIFKYFNKYYLPLSKTRYKSFIELTKALNMINTYAEVIKYGILINVHVERILLFSWVLRMLRKLHMRLVLAEI